MMKKSIKDISKNETENYFKNNLKRENGITLVALVVSIIVMIILASATLQTTFTAYETTRAEKFKAQLRAVQEGVNNFNSEWKDWKKQAEIENQSLINLGKTVDDANFQESISIESFLKYKIGKLNNDGIIQLEDKNDDGILDDNDINIDDIFISKNMAELKNQKIIPDECYKEILLRYAGVEKESDLGLNSDLESDKIVWSNLEYSPIFSETAETFAKIKADTLVLLENKFLSKEKYDFRILGNSKFFKLEPEDIENYLGIRNVDIPVYVNFESGFIFTPNSVTVDGEKIYTHYTFTENSSFAEQNIISNTDFADILVDVKANYGTSKKIKLTLYSEESEDKSINKNKFVDYRIRKAYYQLDNDNIWHEVDDLKECKYSEDGKSVEFIVYESGNYKFKIKDVNNSTTEKMKYNKFENIEKYDDIAYSPEKYIDVKNEFSITLCNAPILTQDMVPVKWIYEDENRTSGYWIVCSTIDPEWYDYSDDKNRKMWANVMLSYDSKISGDTIKVGTKLEEKEMGSMFVWVPRFAGGTNKSTNELEVYFLRDKSRTRTNGDRIYTADLVATAFSNYGKENDDKWDTELKGIWMSKYNTGIEDTGNQDDYNVPYNVSLNNIKKAVADGNNPFYPVSKPYKNTWRNISFENAFSQSIMYFNNFADTTAEYYNENINSHLMRESEWEALRILTSSVYGNKNIQSNTSNRYTGGSDGKSGLNLISAIKQSSTENVTGVFDVSGKINIMVGQVGKANGNLDNYLYDYNGRIINDNITNSNKYLRVVSGVPSGEITMRGHLKYNSTNKVLANLVAESSYDVKNSANENNGFRIVLANSISAGELNTFGVRSEIEGEYDSNESGFYDITEKKFYKWDEMIGLGWIDEKVIYFPEDYENNGYEELNDVLRNGDVKQISGKNYYGYNSVVAGSNISALKAKQGYLTIQNGIQAITGYSKSGDIEITSSNNTFTYWNGLLKVNMPESVEIIGKQAFLLCSKLSEVKMSDNIKIIAESGFDSNEKLKNISIPEEVIIIGKDAFYNCRILESISLTPKVRLIADRCFDCCYNVNSLNLSYMENPVIFGNNAFTRLENLKSVVIPSNVTKMGDNCFDYCSSLEEIQFEDNSNCTYIGQKCFSNDSKLKEFTFPESVSEMGGGMFLYCSSLEKVTFNNNPSSYVLNVGISGVSQDVAGFFSCCSNLEEINFKDQKNTLPDNLTSIGEYAFYGCKKLNQLTIPYKKLERIDYYAFAKLDSIELTYTGKFEDWLKIKHKVENGTIRVQKDFWNSSLTQYSRNKFTTSPILWYGSKTSGFNNVTVKTSDRVKLVYNSTTTMKPTTY